VRAKQVVDVLHAGHGVNMQMVLIPVCQAWGTLVWWRTMKSSDIKVTLRGLVPTPTGCGVFLGNDEKIITIFVDHNVAAAITMFLRGIKKPRPLTHDLISNILAGLDVRVNKVVINDLREDTFFARCYLVQENELGRNVVEIDARPSDSIAIALQQQCPIYVAPHVWAATEDMTWALEQASKDQEEPPDENEPDNE